MAKTLSKMVPLHSKAADFKLYSPLHDKFETLDGLMGDKGIVVMFICNHCPFVVHIRSALVEMVSLYQKRGISFVGINSNDVENYPEDSVEKMIEYAQKYHYNFAYLWDETQQVAKDYDATCTPDFFFYNTNKELVYRGRFDGSTPGNSIPVTGDELKKALDLHLDSNEIVPYQNPSIGCNIKWSTK